MKKCSKCKQERPLERFCKHSWTRDGLMSVCKNCSNENNKKWISKNKKKVKEYSKQWRENNREKAREAARIWREKNKDKINECKKDRKEYFKQRNIKIEQEKKEEYMMKRINEWKELNKKINKEIIYERKKPNTYSCKKPKIRRAKRYQDYLKEADEETLSYLPNYYSLKQKS